jgi:hypothetical protein
MTRSGSGMSLWRWANAVVAFGLAAVLGVGALKVLVMVLLILWGMWKSPMEAGGLVASLGGFGLILVILAVMAWWMWRYAKKMVEP